MRIFYGAAHEQFSPADALRHSQLAVQAGFDGVFCSDHFQPYHPALIVQCWATLEVMFPGRVFLGYGSGESLNESPDEAALEGARKWKGAQPPEYYVDDWHDPPRMYEHAEETISDEEYKQNAVLSADPAEHVEQLSALQELGATSIAVMNCSGADPEGAIRVYADRVLPKLRQS